MAMNFTKIPADTFKKLQMNAGILVNNFNPLTGEIGAIVGATSGGVSFNANPSYTDFGEDIDNCPKNTMELKKLESWETVQMTGTFVSVSLNLAKKLVAVADIDAENEIHIIPRNEIELTDFGDIWWIGDYSDVNTGNDAGFLAIHLFNALSTGGFQIQSGDKAKGTFSFEFTGHYSINAQDVVPFEIYVKEGQTTPVVLSGIGVSPSIASMDVNEKLALITTLYPKGATGDVTYSTSDDTIATVDENGEITAIAEGSATITATCGTYSDSCAVTVVAGA